MELPAVVVVAILLALAFDFLNGFHDAANAIATIVVTKTLTPFQAVVLAGFANFVGYFVFGTTIASTVGKGIVESRMIDIEIILAALMGAIFWNILTWLLGLPTSSSHALIGSLVGSAVAAVGPQAVIAGGLLKVGLFIFIAPTLGLLGAVLFTLLVNRAFSRASYSRTKPLFRKLQLVSASLYSLSHGTNDAQKTMGIIALVLFSTGVIPAFQVDPWVALSCHAAIGLGTMFGGWRIVKTLGTNLTKIHAKEGFCAETSSAAVLFVTAHFGIPVSTTHVISGAIMGVGAAESARSVRWITARRILWAWILTIPVTAAVGGLTFLLVDCFY
jgi:PiT family inorganic phosphate transporter